MKRVKYVIFGAGYRGKKIFEYLGAENIVAFIDSNNKKVGKTFCGKKIVSLKDYRREYEDCFIIISPFHCKMIINQLAEEEIFQFTPVVDMPSEFNTNSYYRFEECYKELKQPEKEYAIYGLNAFSLLLYEYLNVESNVCIVPANNDNKVASWLKSKYPDIVLKMPDMIGNMEELLVTTRQIGSKDIPFFANNVRRDMLEYSDNLSVYYHEELEKFRNMFGDRKRCFITATGPSMRVQDLEMLKENKEFCIGVNSLCMLESKWKPNVFVVTDGVFWENHREDILNYDSEFLFIPDTFKVMNDKRRKNIYCFHHAFRWLSEESDNPMFSEDICQKIYGGATVIYNCIQLAVYFGFKEIYLLGVDCNYVQGSRNNHFILDHKEDMVSYRYEENEVEIDMMTCYKIAKYYADSHGIKIFNATRGGMLEVFERVDFDAIFRKV